MKKIVSILLMVAMLLTGLAGCGGGGSKSDVATLSPESTGVKLGNGVSVELGNYVLDGEAEFTVAKLPVEENKNEGYKIEAYDFKLGDMTSSPCASPMMNPTAKRGKTLQNAWGQSTKTKPPARSASETRANAAPISPIFIRTLPASTNSRR